MKLTSQTAHADNDKSLDIDVIAKDVSELESTEEWQLPTFTGMSDKEMLIAQQQQDSTLQKIRSWAETGDFQYSYKDNVLVHSQEDDIGHDYFRIVVPVNRRHQLFDWHMHLLQQDISLGGRH